MIRMLYGVLVVTALSACTEVASPPIPPLTAAMTLASNCDPTVAIIECDQNPDGPAPETGINIGYTWQTCFAPATDVDADGIADECERQLAAAFAPGLMVSTGDCNWDAPLNRVGGEYYYMVKRPVNTTDRIRIAYMPAYYRDCGRGAHTGDSEFIGVDVQTLPNGKWVFMGAFLSAHCGAQLEFFGVDTGIDVDPDCRYYQHELWNADNYVNVYRGAPKVWTSIGKHANYRSLSHCLNSLAARSYLTDICVPWQVMRRFPVVHRWQNVDFPEANAYGCVPPRWGSSIPTPSARESFRIGGCMFDAYPEFHGWIRPITGGGTSYDYALRYYLRMWPATGALPPNECTYDPVSAITIPC